MSSPSVVVAMLTYRRPDDLPEALPAVLAQCRSIDPPATVLIIDNDPDASAMVLAERYPPEEVRFVHEPTPGIAAARNRALAEATEDLLVFIDDDERPQDDWLELLVATWAATRPAAVVGRVVSSYPSEPEAWIREGGFFDRRSLRTGTEIDTAATNNLLLDLAQVRDLAVGFDERFGTSGGSDTLFSRELHRRGGRLVWCDEAVVVDVVPTSRYNRRWVLRRALRYGNTRSRTTLVLEGNPARRLLTRFRLSVEGLGRMAVGGARHLFGRVTGRLGHDARGARTWYRGLGMLGGAWGWTYVEYRRRPRAKR